MLKFGNILKTALFAFIMLQTVASSFPTERVHCSCSLPPIQRGGFQTRLSSRALAVTMVTIMVIALLSSLQLVPPVEAFDPATDILFEYGAEGADLGDVPKPPFDMAGPTGTGTSDGYVRVSDEHVRTGSKSVKLYQPPPVKSDAERRVLVREYSSGTQDMYFSWWVYVTDSMTTQYSWRTLGGLTLRYGNVANGRWYYRSAVRFVVRGSDGRISARIDYLFARVSSPPSSEYDTFSSDHTLDDLAGTWAHFQVRYKMSQTASGIWTAWINDEEVVSLAGIMTDPRGDARWNAENCLWTYSDFPYLSAALYNERTEPECWCYVDDLVMSTTKVPESYGVGSRVPGDVDGDGNVDYDDFVVLAGCYGLSAGRPGYAPLADFNGDGYINYEDLIILAGNYGRIAV